MARIIILLLFLTILAGSIKRVQVVGNTSLTKQYAEAAAMISRGERLARDGDIIVRDYVDHLSQAIKKFNRIDPSYSHAGIVMIENGYPFVYHVLPGRQYNKGNICRDSLKRFCEPAEINGYGIFRYPISPQGIHLVKLQLNAWLSKGIRFDPWFSYKTDDLLYCSEMVAKLIIKANHGAIRFDFTKPTIMEKQIYLSRFPKAKQHHLEDSILAIDNLYMNPQCEPIARFRYLPN